jgi:hypothetical protein
MFKLGKLASSAFASISALCVGSSQSLPVCAAGYTLPSNLNLSSTRRTIVEPANLPAVQIIVGGRHQLVTGGQAVTPAMAAAVAQVLSGGRQTLLVGLNGAASGGNLILTSASSLTALAVPRGVTIVRDFGASQLNVTGNLTNSGTLYALSTNHDLTNAVISAVDVVNARGALLTTVLPAAGLPGFSDAAGNLGLTLNARTVKNAGTISSAGDLTLNGTGSNFLVQNSGGILSAAGNINITAARAGAHNWLNVLGSQILAPQLNLNAANGQLNAQVATVSGIVNATACGANIGSWNSDLKLGSLNLHGDPTFWSTGSPSAIPCRLVA